MPKGRTLRILSRSVCLDFIDVKKIAPEVISKVASVIKVKSDFDAFQIINNFHQLLSFDKQIEDKNKIAKKTNDFLIKNNFNVAKGY